MLSNLLKDMIDNIKEDKEYNKEYSKIYRNIHKYWARKPWYIVEEYIKSYSQEKELVMDVFCGSGCTGLESILNNRNFIGYDLNPIAVTISEGTMNTDVNIQKMLDEFGIIKEKCENKIMELFKSEEKCETCDSFLYFKHYLIGPKYSEEPEGSLYCPNCNKRRSVKHKKLNSKEIAYMESIEEDLEITCWYPEVSFPEKFYKDRFSYKGILKVSDMYTRKNLYSASLILDAIKSLESEYEELYLLAFTNTILHISKLKGENVRPLGVNNYWVPDDYIEENPWFRFENRFNNIITSKTTLINRVNDYNKELGQYNIYNESTLSLNTDTEKKADYIFTDPPYGDTIQYSELSFMWNAWLGKKYNIEEEVIINPKQDKGEKEFNNLLSKGLQKIYELLKDEKYFTLCFQNKDFKIWEDVLDTCANLGFILHDVNIYDTFGNPYNHNWAKFSPKSDIYVTFKKTNKTDKTKYFNKKYSLKDIINEVMEFIVNNEIGIDIVKVYDITISLLIWNYFFNSEKIEITKFDTKIFQNMIDEWMQTNNCREIE